MKPFGSLLFNRVPLQRDSTDHVAAVDHRIVPYAQRKPDRISLYHFNVLEYIEYSGEGFPGLKDLTGPAEPLKQASAMR